MSRFVEKLKEVSIKDIFHIFLFVVALIPALILKRRRPHIWLICESRTEARDNGYWIFQYIAENQKECDVIYAIDPKCPDYEKVRHLGKTISYGTLKHWIYYLAAEINISSQKSGKPNAAICYLLEVYGIRKNSRVFLQHGIIMNNLPYIHYENAKFSLFCTAAEREYEYVRDYFHYPQGAVQLLGLTRFDRLYRAMKEYRASEKGQKKILVMPTWRKWIAPPSSARSEYDSLEKFKETAYYKAWNSLITDARLIEVLRQNDDKLIFYMHRNMRRFQESMKSDCPQIEIRDESNADIQELIIDCNLMITDYSSVGMDFAYMNKPLVYYQFDYKEFREKHLQEGYFSYLEDGFGPVVENNKEIVDFLVAYLGADWQENEMYARRRNAFFSLRDDKNCERTYQAIQQMLR